MLYSRWACGSMSATQDILKIQIERVQSRRKDDVPILRDSPNVFFFLQFIASNKCGLVTHLQINHYYHLGSISKKRSLDQRAEKHNCYIKPLNLASFIPVEMNSIGCEHIYRTMVAMPRTLVQFAWESFCTVETFLERSNFNVILESNAKH